MTRGGKTEEKKEEKERRENVCARKAQNKGMKRLESFRNDDFD